MKKLSIKTLRNKADKLFSQCCFKKYGDRCECCGKEGHGVHHYFPKSISSFLRYNMDNGIILCTYCHIIRIHSQADPRVFEEIIKKRGAKWWEGLKAKKREGESKSSFMTVKYIQGKIKEFEEYLNT